MPQTPFRGNPARDIWIRSGARSTRPAKARRTIKLHTSAHANKMDVFGDDANFDACLALPHPQVFSKMFPAVLFAECKSAFCPSGGGSSLPGCSMTFRSNARIHWRYAGTLSRMTGIRVTNLFSRASVAAFWSANRKLQKAFPFRKIISPWPFDWKPATGSNSVHGPRHRGRWRAEFSRNGIMPLTSNCLTLRSQSRDAGAAK